MMRCGVLRMVSACDRGLCGGLGYCGGLGSVLMWGDWRPMRIGNGFYGLGPYGSESPRAISLCDQLRSGGLWLTLTLGYQVSGWSGRG